jgi:hypothetical protein
LWTPRGGKFVTSGPITASGESTERYRERSLRLLHL